MNLNVRNQLKIHIFFLGRRREAKGLSKQKTKKGYGGYEGSNDITREIFFFWQVNQDKLKFRFGPEPICQNLEPHLNWHVITFIELKDSYE